ncbi:TPA: hypothetical protein ACH3X1_003629 [Trebouxia sp. C0004]
MEDIMLKEQELADQDAEAIERDRKARADADAALMALNNPANTTADNAEAASTSSDPAGHAAATNTADSMELCSLQSWYSCLLSTLRLMSNRSARIVWSASTVSWWTLTLQIH